jgi:nucleotide-binding universal stress UspA family protein
MTFDSILALTDFSAPSEHALDRAALLATQHAAPLRLMYFSEEPHRFFSDPIARLYQRARQLTRRHGIGVHVVERHPVKPEEILQESRTASLLVMGPLCTRAELVVVGKRRASALARFFTGSVAQRLAKWAASDVLVVPFDGLVEPTTEMVHPA